MFLKNVSSPIDTSVLELQVPSHICTEKGSGRPCASPTLQGKMNQWVAYPVQCPLSITQQPQHGLDHLPIHCTARTGPPTRLLHNTDWTTYLSTAQHGLDHLPIHCTARTGPPTHPLLSLLCKLCIFKVLASQLVIFLFVLRCKFLWA